MKTILLKGKIDITNKAINLLKDQMLAPLIYKAEISISYFEKIKEYSFIQVSKKETKTNISLNEVSLIKGILKNVEDCYDINYSPMQKESDIYDIYDSIERDLTIALEEACSKNVINYIKIRIKNIDSF